MTAAPSPRSRADGPRPGLRKRKKIRTRQAIRAAAFGLIQEQGCDATTIEQIADRAEVSPSTVFRSFPVKEDIVLTDAYDPVMAAEPAARPGDEPWPTTLRHALRKAVERGLGEDAELTRLGTRLPAEVPAVRADAGEHVGHGTAARPRPRRPHRSRPGGVSSMSLAGGLVEVTRYWAEHGHEEDLATAVERALDVLSTACPPPEKAEATASRRGILTG
ncbi:TetR/AcrR family transcriptional regulator [Streptomyces sp. CA-251251]|uniref:TetR/AcrR family transcriptional regulator n=1 Tax=Streptomyces sp. CA-251251 TaxID=3240063 RepID=UPI003D92ECB0